MEMGASEQNANDIWSHATLLYDTRFLFLIPVLELACVYPSLFVMMRVRFDKGRKTPAKSNGCAGNVSKETWREANEGLTIIANYCIISFLCC